MDSEEFRAILSRSRVGIWAMIDAAIVVAGSDYGDELRRRRDGIVEALYAPAPQVCRNCSGGVHDDVEVDDQCFQNRNSGKVNYSSDDGDHKDNNNNYDSDAKINVDDDKSDRNMNLDLDLSKSALTPESNHLDLSGGNEEDDVDPYEGMFDDEQTKILGIKEQLEKPEQSEEAVVELLQDLSDMDITFQALKETDIGRHVNRLRKYHSEEVRRLVKQLVRKWKETVDDWVKVNQRQGTSSVNADVDSPQQNMSKNQQNVNHQVPDFGYSPNPRNGGSTADRHNAEYETNRKAPQSAAARREAPSRPPQSAPPKSASSAPPNRAPKESVLDDERLNTARRRLQENYQEAQNAKKQRTIQMMDIHEIPKAKNSFFAKNKGGFQGRR